MNKSDFPLLTNRPNLVYLDSAATSQKPQIVLDAMTDFYSHSYANVHRGIYSLSEEATALYEDARAVMAQLLHTNSNNIIFTSGTTEGLNLVAMGFAAKVLEPNSDDIILVTEMEHHSNLLPWQRIASQLKVKLEFVKVAPDFTLDLVSLQKFLETKKVRILALTHVSNVLGTINPIDQISAIVRTISPKTIIALDAAQSAPHMPLDVAALDVDFLAFSGHKMLGPTGIGILYGKDKVLAQMDPVMLGGGMISKVERKQAEWTDIPFRFEAGTPNITGAIGLAAAAKYLMELGFANLTKYEDEISSYLLARITDIPDLTLYGPDSMKNRSGVFSFTIKGIHPHDLAQLLDEDQVAVRAGHHCNQVLMREVLGVSATVRASLYLYNDYRDIDMLIQGLLKAKDKFARKL